MELISTKICKTSDIGVNDNLFGGTMLAWLDEAGGIMASSVCCTPNLVTVKINEVLFKKPVKVKEHLRIYGTVPKVGRSSVTISVEARKVMFSDAAEDSVCSTEMVFVKIDKNGNASPIKEEVRNKLINQLKVI